MGYWVNCYRLSLYKQTVRSLYTQSERLACVAGCKLDLIPVRVGLHKGCPLLLILFITFMDRISRSSKGAEGFQFSGVGISSLLFVDDMVSIGSIG